MQAYYQRLSKIFLKEFIELNTNMAIKKWETCKIKYKHCDCFLEYTYFKDDLTACKYFCFNKNCQHKFDKKWIKLFFNTYRFSNYDNNKFILLFQKCVYPYEYIDDWEKVNEKMSPEKEDFYSHLNLEDITDAYYAHAKTVCNDFE